MRLKVPFLRYALGLIAFLLPPALLAAVLPFLVNAQPVRAKLIRELSSWTGGEVKVAGAISVRDFFSLSVAASEVEIGKFKLLPAIEGMKARRVIARIDWSDLLVGRFEFDKITVQGARFKVSTGEPADLPALLADLVSGPNGRSFAALTCDDGRVALRTGPRKPYRRLALRNGVIRSTKSGRQLVSSAHLVWKNQRLDLSLRSGFGVPRGGPVPLRVQLTSELIEAQFNGEATLRTADAEGEVQLSTPDIAKAADWLGLDAGRMLAMPAALSGQLSLAGEMVTLTSGEVTLAGQTAQTGLTLRRRSGALPHLEGTLAFGAVDLKAIFSGERRLERLADGSTAGAFVETDLRVSAKTVGWDSLSAGPLALVLTTRPQRMTAEVAELDFLGGEVRGHVAMDTDGLESRATARLSAEGLDAAAVLRLAQQREWLTGAADVNLEAEAAWDDPAELPGRLVAKARVNFPEGGQLALDLPRLAESASGGAEGWGPFDFTTTAFDKLRFELKLRDGQLDFANVLLASAGRHISGRGEIDLAGRALDWRLTFDPGAAQQSKPAAGIAPLAPRISIKGSWDRPVILGMDNPPEKPVLAAPGGAALEPPAQAR